MEYRIFISYSHIDDEYKKVLEMHLSTMKRKYKESMKIWSDSDLNAGDELDDEIQHQLKQSNIFVCILSSNFLSSTYCYEKELSVAKENDKQIVPIVARPCDWKNDEKLSNILSATYNGKSISEYQNKDLAYMEVVAQLYKIIDHMERSFEESVEREKSNTERCGQSKEGLSERNLGTTVNEEENSNNVSLLHNLNNWDELDLFFKNDKESAIAYIKKVISGEDFIPRHVLYFEKLVKQYFSDGRWLDLGLEVICLLIHKEEFEEKLCESYKKIWDKLKNSILTENNDTIYSKTQCKCYRAIMLWYKCPELYKIINYDDKIRFYNICVSNQDYFLQSYFIHPEGFHIERCIELHKKKSADYYKKHKWINTWEVPSVDKRILETMYRDGKVTIDDYYKYLIYLMETAITFASAETILEENFCKTYNDFTPQQIKSMLKVMDRNSQFYDMGKHCESGKYKRLDEYLMNISRQIKKRLNDDTFSLQNIKL